MSLCVLRFENLRVTDAVAVEEAEKIYADHDWVDALALLPRTGLLQRRDGYLQSSSSGSRDQGLTNGRPNAITHIVRLFLGLCLVTMLTNIPHLRVRLFKWSSG